MAAKVHVTWNDVEKYVDSVVARYSVPDVFPGVYGLPRGGLVLAVMISHRLHIPMLMSPVPGCLIVDDICDTGESLLHYVKDSSGTGEQRYLITTMFYKENELGIEPDMWQFSKGNNWIVFPWEEA